MTYFHSQTLRAVDANLDRAAEGLRVLEDVARFCLDSLPVSAELKSLRNRLLAGIPFTSAELTSARDSSGDVGRNPEAAKIPSTGLADTVTANARRVEQSLRVLEELARLPDSRLSGALFESIRYRVYDLEKELTGAVGRRHRLKRLGEHYLITGNIAAAAEALAEPATTVQLNESGAGRGELWRQALNLSGSQTPDKGLFIIGEYADIAVAVNADGVAINGGSLPPGVIRKLLAVDQLIGFAARDTDEAVKAADSGADYLVCPAALKNTLAGRVGIPVITPQETAAV
ncbi:MAG: thiamine phosphate synthase [Dehalogenimonas sp.]|uniref:Thiamine phosphate synthase n=1 Tax=Candidatus Dehalogenimonas loeffleri TaxID=3127115 RepID=A0ABZ2J8S1_9CHLR|nr:thiamine phosphate synthase [Dehalogenimonas sp.]